MDIDLLKPIKPNGLWNTLNPWSYANKQFKQQQKIWLSKNSNHIDKIKILISNILKITSHIIGILITFFFTSTPWLMPNVDVLLGIGTYNTNYHFSWPDHVALTLFPMLGHISLNIITKLGNYGKLIKYGLITIPIIITSPYLIYQYKNIKKHKKECILCKTHSNKILKEKVE